MTKGVGGRYGRAYLFAKAMNALAKRGMHKPPLTALNESTRCWFMVSTMLTPIGPTFR
jgi:hypothetical protein